MKKLSLVLPCHNEAESIDPVLGEVLSLQAAWRESHPDVELEVLVVDDGSTDDSWLRLKRYREQVTLIRHSENHGYGRALKTGFANATGDWLGFFDLDDTCRAADVTKLMNIARSAQLEMICGNRMQTGTRMPAQRWVGNWLYQSLTRLLVDARVSDCCTGFRLFDAKYKQLFCEILPDDLDFSLAMTVAFLRMGGRYEEHPIRYGDRRGQSKLQIWNHGPKFLMTLLHYSTSRRYSRQELHARIN